MKLDQFTGCLVGEALGDAFGYSIEPLSFEEIVKKYGGNGLTNLEYAYSQTKALISDDTQLALYTIEGLLMAKRRACHDKPTKLASCCFFFYQKWLERQGYCIEKGQDDMLLLEGEYMDSALIRCIEMQERRRPEMEIIEVLKNIKYQMYGTPEIPINVLKGYSGLPRVAPVGVSCQSDVRRAFELGCEVAAITHNHPTAFLSAGTFAAILALVCQNISFDSAIQSAIYILRQYPNNCETVSAIQRAVELSNCGNPTVEKLESLGGGWEAQEVLAIALYATLCYPRDFKRAVMFAANHSGNSSSTAAVCGSIMGAALGLNELPRDWLTGLECNDLILSMAEQLWSSFEGQY